MDGSTGKGPNSARLTELRSQLDAIKEYLFLSSDIELTFLENKQL